MRLQGREVSPTRASQLALRDEQKLIREGYEFLDEKRMLLAQELLRQLQAFSALNERRQEVYLSARDTVVAALMRHGLEELSVYPPPFGDELGANVASRNFIGFALVEAELVPDTPVIDGHAAEAAFPSFEASACAEAFHQLISIDVERAAVSANLHRLAQEYIATERRARALENVLLPEIAVAVKQIGENLEASEQEEAMQVRHAKFTHAS